MDLSSDFKELVRSRTEIVSLIGESTTLIPERGGAEYKCLCPFHDDTNPSMRVYPDRQSFRCWVCDTGGDVFTWVMKREALSFPETMRFLAERAHIEIPEQSKQQSEQFAKKEELHAVLKWAELQFHECFLKSSEAKDARDYIAGRGYSQQTVEEFRLGYHPEDWDWIQRKAKSQFSIEALQQSQLIRKQDDRPGYSDYFVDRVLFPIHDERRRTVAFGGRLIPGHKERGGKYFNSKESPVFHKSRVLYGLPNARDGIRDTNTVLVVEGYADCVACHQFGVRNVVATLGTALTELHCTRLKAFAQKVVMVYDGDDAGQNAAAKAVGMLIGQSVDLRVLTLPEGADPDDYLKQNGTEAFQNLVDKAPEAWEFRFNYEVTKHGLDSINSRETVVTEMLNLLAGASDLQGSAREDIILGRLAPRLQLTEGAIRNQLQRIRSGSRPQQFQTKPAHEEQPAVVQEERIEVHRRPLSKNDRMECELLEILLTEPELAEQTRQEIGVDDFLNPHLRELLQIVYDVVELGEVPSFERVTLEMERNELKGMTVWLADQAREKGIEHKLRENTDGGASNLLSQVLGALKWRREELSHKADFQKQAMSGEGSDALSMLQKAAAFHRKRVMNQR
ncbi:MAG: DNA primase [Planctomycetota bacterium]|nr:DNA primase [Planctomycetota bacterium]